MADMRMITVALIALIFVVVLAIMLQGMLGIPDKALDFLENAIAMPALAALLTSWRAWSDGGAWQNKGNYDSGSRY